MELITSTSSENLDVKPNYTHPTTAASENALVVDNSTNIEKENTKKIEDKNSYRKASASALSILKESEKRIQEVLKHGVKISPPIIKRYGFVAIKSGTINMIQGAQGSHKSRLAAMIVILLIQKQKEVGLEILGYTCDQHGKILVAYIDTERNLEEEFAPAIGEIIKSAGYDIKDDIPHFSYCSLKQLARTKRLDAIKQYISDLRSDSLLPIFVVLDVTTDCITDFNDVKESLALFDFLGKVCENFKMTFLLIIHENPNSSKARGHVGTEGQNKASYVLSIKLKGRRIRLEEVKNRNFETHPPVEFKFDSDSNSFIESSLSLHETKSKESSTDKIINSLAEVLKVEKTQKELITVLKPIVNLSENTIKNKLKTISDDSTIISNNSGSQFRLIISSNSGKPTMCKLEEI